MRKAIAIIIMVPAAILFAIAESIWEDAFTWYLEGYNRALTAYIENHRKPEASHDPYTFPRH